jgi:formylglycine-generating enzyme required for sulfatase activity
VAEDSGLLLPLAMIYKIFKVAISNCGWQKCVVVYNYPSVFEFDHAHRFSDACDQTMSTFRNSLVTLTILFCGCDDIQEPSSRPSVPQDVAASFETTVVKPSLPDDLPEVTPDAVTIKKLMTQDQLALGDPVVNSIGMVLVPIPAGKFQMGNRENCPQHLVKITKAFYLGAFEVTQQQFEKVMGTHPWNGMWRVKEGFEYPATELSHDDAVEFCRKLSELENAEYRLPTEAEWEYACRAGTTTEFSFGDEASGLAEYAWFFSNTYEIDQMYAHRVGQKLPNSWGVFDMYGNVFEWCSDRYAPYDMQEIVIDPTGPDTGTFRTLRGGGFDSQAADVRSGIRGFYSPDSHNNDVGFRVARTIPSAPLTDFSPAEGGSDVKKRFR